MKSYTDLEQSKKLAEILPIESADMWWNYYTATIDDTTPLIIRINEPWVGSFNWENKPDNIPCWSLAALLGSVKYNTINLHYNDVRNDWMVSCTVEHSTRYESGRALNPIDACYELIIKLKEMDLL